MKATKTTHTQENSRCKTTLIGTAEINAATKDLKDDYQPVYTQVIHLSYAEKKDRFWRRVVDYCKFSQMVTPNAAAILDVVSLLSKLTHTLAPGLLLLS